MADKIFVDGMNAKEANVDWIVAKMGVKVADHIKFMLKQCPELDLHNPHIIDFIKHIDGIIADKWLNYQIPKSKKGGLYVELDTWKPKGQDSVVAEQDIDTVVSNLVDHKREALAAAEAKEKQAREDALVDDPSQIPF